MNNKKKKKKREKRRRLVNASFALIKAFSIIVSTAFLLFIMLFISTSRTGLQRLTNDYINNQKIPDTYYEAYEKRGFTKDEYFNLLNGKEIRELTAGVLSDHLMGIFHHDIEYQFTKSNCDDKMRKILEKFTSDNSIPLSENNLVSLTSYTMDICGITTMLLYDTPAAYRTAIFDANSDDFESIDNTLDIISKMAKWVYPVALYVMHLISILYLCIIYRMNYNDLKYHVCSTMLYPALFILALATGELFCIKTTSIAGIYLAKIGALTGGIGTILAIIETVVSTLIIRDKHQGTKDKGKKEVREKN